MNDEIDILLARYFSGEATKNELRELDDWIEKDTENESYFEQMTDLYQKTAMQSPIDTIDTQTALQDFQSYMRNSATKQLTKRPWRVYKYAIAASVALLVGIAMFFFLQKPADSYQLIASSDTTQEYQLFENVGVVLAPESQISYKATTENELKLLGKATFEVNPDFENELLVLAGTTYIKDIGTVFTVTAYAPEETVTVEVAEGEVLFYTLTNKGIALRENQTGIYYAKTDQFELLEQKNETKEFVFQSVPLSEVVKTIEQHYGIQVSVNDNSLLEKQISISFSSDDAAEHVLRVIALTFSARIIQEANIFVLSTK